MIEREQATLDAHDAASGGPADHLLERLASLVGARTGYPVLRPEAPRASAGEPFGAGEGVAARWSGRIGTESVPAGIPRAARIGLTCDGEACELEVTDERGVHRLAIRRGSPMQVGRLCRIGGCVPGLRIHAPGADVTLEPATAVDRDRLAALLR